MRSLGLVMLSAGCLRALAPDVGPPATPADGASGACSNADSDPATTIHFAVDLHDGIFKSAGCLDCHTGDGIGVQQSGLDLSSYATLRAGGGRSGAAIVVDRMPCTSILVEKVGLAPPFGRRMPYNGPPYLSEADIQRIWDWIAEGARDN